MSAGEIGGLLLPPYPEHAPHTAAAPPRAPKHDQNPQLHTQELLGEKPRQNPAPQAAPDPLSHIFRRS